MKGKKGILALIPFVLVAGMTVVVLCILYNGIDLTRPIIYKGDGVSATYLVKTIKDTGWFLHNPWVGGKYGGNWADYTMCDNLSFLLIKLLSLFFDNCFQIFNLFYFLTFVLVSLTAYGVFRALKVNTVVGMAGALLYSFLAYHQRRVSHIWLTPYFMVPLGILVGIWIATDHYRVDELKGKALFCSKKIWASVVILFLCAFTGFYYAFFTCIVICIAGVILCLKKINVRRVLFVLSGLGVVCLGVLANVYPSLIYWIRHGTNMESELVIRSASDAETYALKLVQLLMPRLDHREGVLAGMAQNYFTKFPLTNENETATLGIVAGISFVFLLLLLFKTKVRRKYVEEIKLLNLGIFITATIGGIGSVFNLVVSTPMRCYNRLSIYIAFLALLYAALTATDLLAKIRRKHIRTVVCIGMSLVVLVVGLWDQTTSFGMAEQAVATQSFDSDREFVQKIEEIMPQNSMIFQLPVIKFPSGGSYELYKGYMHSSHTIWSYGGMQGREEDRWETNLMNYPVNEFLDHLCYAGYRGLYVDSQFFIQMGFDFDMFLQKMGMSISEPAIASADGRLYFWDLTGYYEQITAVLGEEMIKQQETLEYKVFTNYDSGFFDKEETLEGISRWAEKKSKMVIRYKGKEPCRCVLVGTVYSGYEEKSELKISVNGRKQVVSFDKTGTEIQIPIELHRGSNVITFTSDAEDVKIEDQASAQNFRLASPILRYGQ